MARLAVQPSINDTRSAAMLKLSERLSQLDLSPMLVYRVDSAPQSALPALAWQFDIQAPLWQLVAPGSQAGSIDAVTDIDALTDIDTLGSGTPSTTSQGEYNYAAMRALLKQAVALHQLRGTPAALKTALATLGWQNAQVLEGQQSWGGTSYPASQGWAVFRVTVPLPQSGSSLLNLVPDSDIIAPQSYWTVWPPASVAPGFHTRTNGVELPASGTAYNAATNVFLSAVAIAVVAGETYTLSGYIDASAVTQGTPCWGVTTANGAPVSFYAEAVQQPGAQGVVSVTFTVPSGVGTLFVFGSTGPGPSLALQAPGSLFFSHPQLELGSTASPYQANEPAPLIAPVGVTARQALAVVTAANFFKPARAWLDAVVFELAPTFDPAPEPDDMLSLLTAALSMLHDAAPSGTDLVSAMLPPIADTKPPVAPRYDAHFYHIGITFGANEPKYVDSGVVVNGTPISANG